jgi:hypothetical protein
MPVPGSRGASTEAVVARLEAVLTALRDQVGHRASRFASMRPGAASTSTTSPPRLSRRGEVPSAARPRSTSAPRAPSGSSSVRRVLVQDDLRGVEPAPPPELVELYGTTAQMLGPLVRDGALVGWMSVHYNDGPRRWTPADVAALEVALTAVHRVLDVSG